ncbi:MAG: penicillin acylase family protein [Acidobacteriota bacterium]|nr:penicillin acylase family protein [Acidobacteriota bacterium]
MGIVPISHGAISGEGIAMNRSRRVFSTMVVVGLALCIAAPATAAELDGPATIKFDQFNVPTIVAQTEHDAIFLEGYLHAQNRFWQMDYQRRLFSGQLAELLGSAAIPTDVQLRTLGLRRAAQRSLTVQTPESLDWLQAYSDGVNAYLLDTSQPLPLEYSFLEIDRGGIPLWTPLDSLTMVKGLAFGLAFDLGDIDRTIALQTFLAVCPGLGCNGLQLFQSDLYRSAPFEPQVSIPPPPPPSGGGDFPDGSDEEWPDYMTDPDFEALIKDYVADIEDIPILNDALKKDLTGQGSNWWVVSGALTDTGNPRLANDPHLALDSPATFYEIHLNVTGGINVTGISFAGAPGIVQGCNDTICWGSTVNPMDVTDVYQEVLQNLNPADPTQPTHTTFDGLPEPLQFIPQTFLFNVSGDGTLNNTLNAGVPATSGGVTIIVPRRNNGPIVNILNPAGPLPIRALSVQYVGWSATQELEAFRRFARATTMQDFKDGLQFFDHGSQNWAYADTSGNIAYYTSGELPIREDLQTLFFPAGLQPPYYIRDGTHTNPHEWMTLANPQPNQALSTEILPFNEMPQIENPAAGYILNANNDPIGTTFGNLPWASFRAGFNGRLYLSPGYATGYRMGRIQRLFDSILASGGTLSESESIAVQANTQLLDAEVLSPYLVDAYNNAIATGAAPELTAIIADSRIGDAVGRIDGWDFSTPTGINEGFDAGDNPAAPGPPTAGEVDASVAATIYAAWRSKVVRRVIDSTMEGAAGVCTADFATLCSPSNDDCATNINKPGGICFNVPTILGDFDGDGTLSNALTSDESMKLVRRLLDNYSTNGGTGSSIVNFFQVPGVFDQDLARDIILLESLRDGLDMLASAEFAPAFDEDGDGSTALDDFRWGRLHRIVLDSSLSPLLSIPPAGSPSNLSPALPGFSVDGGMGAVDASSHSARAETLNGFMFGSGPSRRLIAELTPSGPQVQQVIPGGESGNAGNPHQADQLPLWLVNANKPLPVSLADVQAITVSELSIDCGDGMVGPGEQCDDGNADENDGCNQACRITPIVTCNTSVPADPGTCSAACEEVSSCADPDGGVVSFTCDPAGPFGLASTSVSVSCTDDEGDVTVVSCDTDVVDITPPTISVSLDPDTLWPPNHQLVEITATVVSSDSCGATTVVLDSVTSDEPDNAAGTGDGNTVGDIRKDMVGTEDYKFDVRAERDATGAGRTYTATYTATDGSGNQTSGAATVFVLHDQGGKTDPLDIALEQNGGGTAVSWAPVTGATFYNVVRVNLEDLVVNTDEYKFEPGTCIEAESTDENTFGNEDAALPEPGKAFVYMVEYKDGKKSGFGTESAAMPRKVGQDNCSY